MTEQLISEIQLLSNQRSFRLVIDKTQKIFDDNIHHSGIYFFRGYAHHELGELKAATPFYLKSIDLSSDVEENDGYSWSKIQSAHNLTNIYFDLNLYDKCIDICNYNKVFFKNHSRMASNMNFYLNSLYQIAHCCYLKNTRPLTSDIHNMLGKLQLFERQQECNTGIECIEEAISLVENRMSGNYVLYVDFLFIAGMLYLIMNKHTVAKSYFKKAADLGDTQAQRQLGKL